MDYYSNKFESCKDDVRRSWKIINEIRSKNSERTLPKSIEIDNKVISNRNNIMSEFNKYFVSVATELKKSKYSRVHAIPDFNKFLKNRVCENFEFANITVSEIEDIIKNFNPNKCSDFSSRLLKLINHSLSPILKYLLNNCMHSAIFPNQLKVAGVLPLYKTGNINDISNYRPISILPIFSKLFKKLLYTRLSNFFAANNVIDSCQYGFWAQHSTSHALHFAISSVSQALINKSKCAGIFIDFQKAFDTVNHHILLQKLDHYGIRGRALSLLNNYLVNRKQYVYDSSDVFSETLPIACGVPQGSVLGPLFFILYVNDISYCVCECLSEKCTNKCREICRFVLFADDTNVFLTAPDNNLLFIKAQHILQKLRTYLDANYLHIHLKKTKFIHFKTPRTNEVSYELFYNDHKIERVEEIRFLGVIINESLNWGSHIDKVIRKLASINDVLYNIRNSLPVNIRKQIYFALVNSCLMYALSVWGCGGNISALKHVFTAQKRAVRTLFGIPKVNKHCKGHSKSKFNDNQILSIHNLYYYSVIMETFKVLNAEIPNAIFSLFNKSSLRDICLIVPYCRLTSLSGNYLYSSASIWNIVAEDIKLDIDHMTSLGTVKFKFILKEFFLNLQHKHDPNAWYDTNYCLP